MRQAPALRDLLLAAALPWWITAIWGENITFLRLWWPGVSVDHFGLTIVLCDIERYAVVAAIDAVAATLFLAGFAALLYARGQKFPHELMLWGYALCAGSSIFYVVVHTWNDLLYWKSFVIFEEGVMAVNTPFVGVFTTAIVATRFFLREVGRRKLTRVGTELVFAEPYRPWPLHDTLVELLKRCERSLKLCVPYPDRSTFEFLAAVPKDVEVKMILVTGKEELKGKAVTKEVLLRTIGGRKFEARRNRSTHSRFLVCDDKVAVFTSVDLKASDMRRKYQFAILTDDESVVAEALRYFDALWEASERIDLFEEVS